MAYPLTVTDVNNAIEVLDTLIEMPYEAESLLQKAKAKMIVNAMKVSRLFLTGISEGYYRRYHGMPDVLGPRDYQTTIYVLEDIQMYFDEQYEIGEFTYIEHENVTHALQDIMETCESVVEAYANIQDRSITKKQFDEVVGNIKDDEAMMDSFRRIIGEYRNK